VNNTFDTMETAMTDGRDDTGDEDFGPLLDPGDALKAGGGASAFTFGAGVATFYFLA
jgi:hypothetical protein